MMYIYGLISQGVLLMIDAEIIIKTLWQPFMKQIRNGDVVYFTFHRQFLVDLFESEKINCDHPVELINSLANVYIEVVGNKASIKPLAFIPLSNGFSPIIILVCQQVLAVEEMVRDESGHSENAYFPRLRKMISSSLQEDSLNPFEFSEFEEVWRTLKKEMQSINVVSEKIATIHFGKGRGVNKARSFPLGQALFSSYDLKTICRIIGLDKLKQSDKDTIWTELRSIRKQLGSRAEKLTGLDFLRQRLLQQIISFSKVITFEHLLDTDEKTPKINVNNDLIFFKDEIDWLSEEFRAYIFNNITKERIDDENVISRHLHYLIDSNNGYMVLALGDSGDHWIKCKSEKEVRSGDTFLLIGNCSGIKTAEAILKRIFNIATFSVSNSQQHSYNIRNDKIILYEVVNDSKYHINFFVSDGGFLNKTSDDSQHDAYFWNGGFCINKKMHLYLIDYLPESIIFGNVTEFNMSDVVKINSKPLEFNYFKNNLEDSTEDRLFEFEFGCGFKANIRIAKSKNENVNYLGFKFNRLKHLNPVVEEIDNTFPMLQGYQLVNYTQTTILPLSVLAAAIDALVHSSSGEKLKNYNLEKIRIIMIKSAPTKQLKSIISQLLVENATLPIQIIKQIEAYF